MFTVSSVFSLPYALEVGMFGEENYGHLSPGKVRLHLPSQLVYIVVAMEDPKEGPRP